MPRLLPEDASLNSRVWKWSLSAAAGAALASFAGLMGRWSADPALGWALAALASGLGAAAGALAAAPDEDGAHAWAAAGALAALAVPALLYVLGLGLADAELLVKPLGESGFALFALGQAVLLAAAAAAAWTRAARGGGLGAAMSALAGAAAAALAFARCEPSLLLAASALGALAAAVLADKPWSRRESAPLRARAFLAAALAGLGLAWFAPDLLLDVWLARLYRAYPGGRYLAAADDGANLWAAFRFSNGTALMLRDGVPQAPDPATVGLVLKVLIGQRSAEQIRVHLLLVQPPEPGPALTAQKDGADVSIEDGSRARAAVLTALGGATAWRGALTGPRAGTKPDVALVFLPRPAGAGLRRLAGASALKALRTRLADDAYVGLLLPPGTAPEAVDGAQRAAAAEFGAARVADLPKGALVLASRAPITVDPAILLNQLPLAVSVGPQTLADDVHWRPAPSTK